MFIVHYKLRYSIVISLC